MSWMMWALAASAAPLELNSATVEQIAAIPGVGFEAAQAIVDLRGARGGLHDVEELRSLGLDAPALASLRAATEFEVAIPVSPTRALDTVDAVLAEFRSEPTVLEVQGWAEEEANTRPEQVRRWLAESESFALLPEVTLDYRIRGDWDQGFEYYDLDGADPISGSDVEAIAEDADQAQTQELKVRLRWQLGDLVMSSERIRVISEAQDVVKLRDKVLGDVTRLYFERRRLQVEVLLAPKIDLVGRVKEELRLLELTANLDALTGGQFSGSVARGGSAR